MRTLSPAALAAQNSDQSDEVWLVKLTITHAEITDGPLRFVNDRFDLRAPPANIFTDRDMMTWTLSNATVEDLGAAVRVTDASGAATGNANADTTGLTSGAAYTMFIRVYKDSVPKTVRQVGIRFGSTAPLTYLILDTSTGELALDTSVGTSAYGVIDDGNAWLVYATNAGATTTRVIEVDPAIGVGATLGAGSYSNAAVGSAVFDRPTLYAGTIADLVQWIAFPFTIDLPGEDPEQAAVARLRIDNVDRRIVEAVRGLTSAPTCQFEVVLASQPETVEIGFYDLTLRAADYDAFVVEGNMTFEQIFTEPCSLEMTPARFPGLF